MCIIAEAGAGKSTLAWRVAVDLFHKNKNNLIIHIREPENESVEVWQKVADFQKKINRPLIVLADDIFRDSDASSAFIGLPPRLPLTILATSRKNEFKLRAKRLKCECSKIELKPPSPKEKDDVLKKLGKSRTDLTTEQKHRLDDADQFIVLMMELQSGKELREIIRDTIKMLFDLEPNHSAYRAYNYLCFAGQFSKAMPVTLLEKLDKDFHKLSDRDVVDGLFFRDSRVNRVRAGHPVVAKCAVDIYTEEKGRSPKQVIKEIVAVLDGKNPEERIFIARLLRDTAGEKLIEAKLLFNLVQNLACSCIQNANRITELTIWRDFCLNCGQYDLAESCAKKGISCEPISAIECDLLRYLCRELNREKDALQPITRWIKNHHNQGHAYISYIGLVEEFSRDEIQNVIFKIDQWLDVNQDDGYVRSAYLGFVERNGTDDQIKRAIEKTNAWLEKPENCYDIDTRNALLGLLRRKWAAHSQGLHSTASDEWLKNKGIVREAELFEQTLKQNINWVIQNPKVKEIWVTLLGLLFSLGRNAEANRLVSNALLHNPDDQNLLQRHLHIL